MYRQVSWCTQTDMFMALRVLHVHWGVQHVAWTLGTVGDTGATGFIQGAVSNLLLPHVWYGNRHAKCSAATEGQSQRDTTLEPTRRAEYLLDEGYGGLRLLYQAQCETQLIIHTSTSTSTAAHTLAHKQGVIGPAITWDIKVVRIMKRRKCFELAHGVLNIKNETSRCSTDHSRHQGG